MSTEKQEPVAWRSWNDKDGFGFWDTKSEAESWCDPDFDSEPLYTHPPKRKWVSLTDNEMKLEAKYFCHSYYLENAERLLLLVRTIEAKLREKNG